MTSLLFGLRVGYSFIPGFAVVQFERGVRWGQGAREWYSSMGPSLPFAYAAYVWGKNRGLDRGVTAPFCGLGYSPLYGRNAFIYVPGLFSLSVTSLGEIGVQVSPFRLFGFFFGWSLFVAHPALKVVTTPMLKRLNRVWDWIYVVIHTRLTAREKLSSASSSLILARRARLGAGSMP